MRPAFLPAVFLSLAACGYRPLYGAEGAGRLHVRLVRTLVADAVASDEVASGLREELAREGALAGGDGWPRVEVEVLREDESSEGIAVAANEPLARAADIGVVARAWIVRSPNAPPERDTGDLRAGDVVAVDGRGTPGEGQPESTSAFHTADALRAAAHRLGRKLAQKLEGYAGLSEETIDR